MRALPAAGSVGIAPRPPNGGLESSEAKVERVAASGKFALSQSGAKHGSVQQKPMLRDATLEVRYKRPLMPPASAPVTRSTKLKRTFPPDALLALLSLINLLIISTICSPLHQNYPPQLTQNSSNLARSQNDNELIEQQQTNNNNNNNNDELQLQSTDLHDLVTYLFNEFYNNDFNASLYHSENPYGDPQSSASLKRELQLHGTNFTAEEIAAIASSSGFLPASSPSATHVSGVSATAGGSPSAAHLHPASAAAAAAAAATAASAVNGSFSELLLGQAAIRAVGNATGAAASAAIAATATAPPERPFFGDAFYQFQSVYWPYHCVLCLVICTLGIFANVTNIIVLTRPNMITAVNTILSAMALSDLIVNISNIPFLMHELSDPNAPSYFSFQWAVYILFHAHTTVTAHTISIWLTCVLATWRYLVVCRSQPSDQRNWTVALAKRTIVAVFLLVPIFCIPNYLSFAIIKAKDNPKNHTIYKVGFSQLAQQSDLIQIFHFSVFSCLTKLVPCVLLTFFTSALIRKLFEARKRRLKLACHNETDKGRLSTPNGFQSNSVKVLANGSGKKKGSGATDPLVFSEAHDDRHHHHNHKFSTGFAACDLTKSAQELGATLVDNPTPGATVTNKLAPDHLSVDPCPLRQREKHARSGSSCATDAEIIATTATTTTSSSNASSSGNEVTGQTRIMSQLIVESDGANNTTVSTSTAPGKVIAACDIDVEAQTNAQAKAQAQATKKKMKSKMQPGSSQILTNATANLLASDIESGQKPCNSPRSASTCGALELYKDKSTKDGSRAISREDMDQGNFGTGSQPLVNSNRELRDDPSSTRSRIGTIYSSNKRASSMAGNGPSMGNQHWSNNRAGASKLAKSDKRSSESASIRNPAKGSTTLAPFQLIKIQAAQKQISQNETTTRLLLAVMIVFLICEFPAGILAFLCAIFGQDFVENVYQPIGFITDLLALINSSVNFILYCFMSTQFRITFYRVVLHCPAPSG